MDYRFKYLIAVVAGLAVLGLLYRLLFSPSVVSGGQQGGGTCSPDPNFIYKDPAQHPGDC